MSTEQPTPARDIGDLAAALQVTEDIIANVRPDQADLPTPCPDYTVAQLVDHLVGYATHFADRACGVTPPADPAATTAGGDPQGAYHDVAGRLLDGYRDGPVEDATPLGIVLMETVAHGWDLAKGTGQPTPYPAAAVESVLAAGQGMLGPQFRGQGKPFGEEVDVPASAPPLDRLVGFLGRDPTWSA